ncbi:MAG TPA: hypothetical protein VK666_14500 [Chryseolinea sp.]|nr:hypothetical protein [Chryseolinea sp.]
MNAAVKTKHRANQAGINAIKSSVDHVDSALQDQLVKIRKELLDLLKILKAL